MCGIHAWLSDQVRIQPGKEIPLGATKTPLPGSIYESYVDHAEMNGFEPMGCCKFGDVLPDALRSRGHRNVEVKRMNCGRLVKGLTLDQEGRPLNRASKSEGVKRLEKDDPWGGFSEDIAEWSERSLAYQLEEGANESVEILEKYCYLFFHMECSGLPFQTDGQVKESLATAF